MRDVLADIEKWRAEGRRVAIATVVATWGSAPRTVGGKMAVGDDRRIAGSVSGGCVEGAVVEAAGEVLASGTPRLLNFGVADDTAWSVGLACGGAIEVFVEPLDDAVFGALREARGAAVATVIRGETRLGRKAAVFSGGGSAGDGDAVLHAAACDALSHG